jgi:hypothetical protein
MCTLSEISNDRALCCHPSAIVTLSLSCCQLKSTLPLTAQFCFCCSLNRVTWSGIIWNFLTSLREFLDPVVSRFTQQALRTVNKKHCFLNIVCVESLSPQKTHSRTLVFGRILLKHSHHFDYWKQPLNMRMRVCYLDCHKAGLYWYLMIHLENVLWPLQLFYFHLWPIYWLSLIIAKCLITPSFSKMAHYRKNVTLEDIPSWGDNPRKIVTVILLLY